MRYNRVLQLELEVVIKWLV